MKNMYGETVKPQYEVALKRLSSMRKDTEQALADEDFETFGNILASNYRDAVMKAKQKSNDIGKEITSDYGTAILREVAVICYFEDDTSSYNQVWQEVYRKGKKEGRYEY